MITIGHINLAQSFNGTGEHFIALVEALDRQGIIQHVIVQNESLARRVSIYDSVSLGPTTSTPVIAYCLMPPVDVVHAHDEKSAQAGLLLALTRSIPFVVTRRRRATPGASPVMRSIYNRAACVISTTDTAAKSLRKFDAAVAVDVIHDISRAGAPDFEMLGNRIAAEHMRVYHRAADRSGLPAMLL